MLEAILDHLWQSTLIVLIAWGATVALRRYGAHWRYWIWFAASMKFLVPFALIAQLGAQLPWPAASYDVAGNDWRALAVRVLQPTASLERSAPTDEQVPAALPVAPPAGSLASEVLMPSAGAGAQAPAAAQTQLVTGQSMASGEAGEAATGGTLAAGTADALQSRFEWFSLPVAALALWLLGSAVLLARWSMSWLALRGALRQARPIRIDAPEPRMPELRACSSVMEPGIFGIFKPVLLIPERLVDRLSRDQLRAIIRHERVHADRRDNLTASLHMLVEALFWFHPFVWWIGARLVDERERACDEAVLASGVDPDVYASGLIEVCDFYVESPLLCAAGVGGGSLESRVKRIAVNARLPVLGRLGRATLIASPALVCLVPLVLGTFEMQTVRAQQAADTQDAGLLECVHPDVLAALVFRGAGSNTRISDEVPEVMDGISPPAEFEWLGSQTRDMSGSGIIGLRSSITAGFKTDLARADAIEAAVAGLTAEGWERAEQQRFGAVGAFAAAVPQQPDVVCRDDRSLSINASEIGGTTYVSYGFTIGQVNSACQDPPGLMSSGGGQYAPSLELPTDPVTGQPARRGGSGSSGTQSRIEIRYNGSLAELTDFMTRQLVEQGWSNDASWSGTTTAGSSWWKQPEPDMRVQGTLDVTATADAAYTIMFRLVALN